MYASNLGYYVLLAIFRQNKKTFWYKNLENSIFFPILWLNINEAMKGELSKNCQES